LHSDGLTVRLCILGDVPEKEKLKILTKELSLEKYIHFHGYIKDIKPYLFKSIIYLQASKSEGLSISLVESMAAGLIPIVTEAGAECDIIKDNFNEFFVPV
jgi:glycosyltransferase involved in cell wall biosynthesis